MLFIIIPLGKDTQSITILGITNMADQIKNFFFFFTLKVMSSNQISAGKLDRSSQSFRRNLFSSFHLITNSTHLTWCIKGKSCHTLINSLTLISFPYL